MKLVCLFLAVTISLFSALPVSADASELDESLMILDLTKYGFPVGWSDNVRYNLSGSTDVSYDMPFSIQIRNIDIVFAVNDGAGAPRVVLPGYSDQALTVVKIDNIYYRAFGQVYNKFPDPFTFRVISDSSYLMIKSVKLSGRASDPHPDVGTVNGVWANGNTNSATMSSPTSPATIRSPFAGSAQHVASGSFTFYSRNWVKYDFVDFYFQISNVYSLSSIEVSFNEQAIPFESSVVSGSSNVNTLVYTVHVVVDCRGLDRRGVQFPIVTVNASTSGDTWVRLLNVTGFVVSSSVSPVVSWFQKLNDNLRNWFSSLQASIVAGFDRLISVLSPDPKPGEDFGSTVESQAGQLGEAGDILGSVTRPPVQDFDVQIDSFVDPADVTFLGGVVRPFMENKIVLTVLLMSFTLATLGYVLYGKR